MTTAAAKPLGEALDQARFTKLHRRFWLLAGLGILLDGFDFFIIGVASPLIKEDFALSAATQGLVSAAAIIGAIFGSALLGPLGDKVGRRKIFQVDLWMFVVFTVACFFAPNVWLLIAFRLLLGVAIGLDYPIAASYLAEVLPSKTRGRSLVAAFSLQAVGILLGALVGVVILNLIPEVHSWRLMLLFGVVPALVIIWLRRGTPESPRWLAQNGHEAEAVEVAEALCDAPVEVTEVDRHKGEEPPEGLKALFQPRLFKRDMIRRTIFTSVPWFLMDIATYGVGVFTPTLLAAIAFDGAGESFIQKDIISTEGTALLDVFLVLGFGAAILLVDRLGRIRLQLTGFAVMAVALTVLGAAELFPGKGTAHIAVIGVAFAFFNFFMNMGPNATTFALPAEVYPSEMRAAGHGFAAGMAKLGAAFGVFLFPILLDSLGTSTTLFLVAGTSVVALGVTYAFRIETKGKSLDEISGHTASALDPRPAPP